MNKDRVIQIAMQSGFGKYAFEAQTMFECFAKAIRNETLEEAAKEFDSRNNGIGFYDPHEPAEIIRNLKEQQ